MLDFNIEINYSQTRIAVEKFMENYENWKIKIEESKLPVLNSGCTLEFSGGSRGYVKSRLETQVIQSIEWQEKLANLTEAVMNAFNRLEERERRYLAYKFFDTVRLSDDEIEERMMLSRHSYIKLKKQAYTRFALALNIEVTVDKNPKRRNRK